MVFCSALCPVNGMNGWVVVGSWKNSSDMRWVMVVSGGWEREMARHWCLVVFFGWIVVRIGG